MPKISLNYIILKNNSNLNSFVIKNNIHNYEQLVEYCKVRKILPVSYEEYSIVFPEEPEVK